MHLEKIEFKFSHLYRLVPLFRIIVTQLKTNPVFIVPLVLRYVG